MKVVAFNGSARKNGNTALMIEQVFDVLKAEGIETELISLAGQDIKGCLACNKCVESQNRRCAAITDDPVNEYIAKIDEAQGVILGSPVYFATLSSSLKVLIDRAGKVAKVNGDMYRRKVGAAVVAVRRAGSVLTFDTINNFFLISQMIIPGSSYWNTGIGHAPGDVSDDAEGMRTMKTLGENMAWLIKKTAS
ncbi:MAG: flavodoxin family protein [Deltaproteobacteria bacterium]|nr:flavodoxin family protein [Candidatus Zymogenaceae bacterium]